MERLTSEYRDTGELGKDLLRVRSLKSLCPPQESENVRNNCSAESIVVMSSVGAEKFYEEQRFIDQYLIVQLPTSSILGPII